MYAQQFTITAVEMVSTSSLGVFLFGLSGVIAMVLMLGMIPKVYTIQAAEIHVGVVMMVMLGYFAIGMKVDQYREKFQPEPGCQYTLTHVNGHRKIQLFTQTHNAKGGICMGEGTTVLRIQYEGGRIEYFVRPSKPLV